MSVDKLFSENAETHPEESNYDLDTSVEISVTSTKLRQWQEEHEKILDAKIKASTTKKLETIAKAKVDLDRFTKERDEKNKKSRENNRNVEKQFRKDYDNKMSQGRPWERVVLHIDTQQKDPIYKDVSRLRTLLIHLKNDQVAPPLVK